MKTSIYLIILSCFTLSIIACDDDNDSTEITNAGEVAAGEVTAGEIEAGEIEAGEIEAGEIEAGEIEAGEMAAGEAAAGEMAAGEVTAGEMMTQEEQMDQMAQRAFDWLIGRFDSVEQAQRQPSYFEIQLLACEVAAEELGQRVLYIEQAQFANPAEPYRQRLYHVDSQVNDDGEIEVISTIYSLALPSAYVGLCDDDTVTSFEPNSYMIREGCEVYLKWVDDHFEGSTRGNGCASSLSGASYATSEVVMTSDLITSWDRGFDANDQQVWGAVDGAYEFVRKE